MIGVVQRWSWTEARNLRCYTVTILRNSPLLVFALSLFVPGLSARIGVFLRDRRGSIDDAARQDFDRVLGATLTLLGLIVGFSFSMAVTRYDQRKSYEEEEANAIGTEYLRVGLLQPSEATKLRDLMTRYLDQRVFVLRIQEQGATRSDQFWNSNISLFTRPVYSERHYLALHTRTDMETSSS